MYGKEFESFLQVCKDGSIRKAAKSLYISPQGLGKSIKTLEQELGIQLFKREKNGIQLTEYGEAIKPFAKNIVDNIKAINNSIEQLNKQIFEPLNVACSLGVIGALNPSLFNGFQKKYPEITLNVIEATDLKVQSIVAEQDDFIGISVGPVDKKGLSERFLTSFNLAWLIKKSNPLAAKEHIEFADVKNERLIMFSKEFMAYYRIMECCRKAGFSPNIICFINEAIMAYILCVKLNALAITVDLAAEYIINEEIVLRTILDEECRWELYLINRNDAKLSKAQQSFINYLFNDKTITTKKSRV